MKRVELKNVVMVLLLLLMLKLIHECVPNTEELKTLHNSRDSRSRDFRYCLMAVALCPWMQSQHDMLRVVGEDDVEDIEGEIA